MSLMLELPYDDPEFEDILDLTHDISAETQFEEEGYYIHVFRVQDYTVLYPSDSFSNMDPIVLHEHPSIEDIREWWKNTVVPGMEDASEDVGEKVKDLLGIDKPKH